MTPPPSKVPLPTSSFVGRALELAELGRLLARSRLVTLVGPGGVGKTRLALELARRRAPSRPVFTVDLTPIRDPALVGRVLALAVGLPAGDPTPNRISQLLGDRRLLVVLDNCEHLIDEAARLAEALLGHCPGAHLLATSRERLALAGESVWPVPPLAAAEASALFLERARARNPRFDAGGTSRTTVADICDRVERVPLAIELAASRSALMTPAEILQRLDDRFSLLSGGSRTAPARMQTMRATVEWSYDLLDPEEQRLFRLVSVFAGGFDLDLVENLGGSEAVDRLGRLVDKSLITATPGEPAPTRYTLLETLREFGLERLLAAGELDAARRLHFECLTARADAAFTERQQAGSATLLYALERDLDNLRAALDWARARDPCGGLRLIGTTREVWFRLAQREGLRRARELLDSCQETGLHRALALLTAGQLGFTQLDHERAAADLQAAARLGTDLGDPGIPAIAAWMLGVSRFLAEDFDKAREHLRESIRLHERTRDSVGSGLAHGSLGTAELLLGHRSEAIALLERGLELVSVAPDQWGIGFCHTYLGIAHAEGGECRPAEEHFRRALAALAPIREVTMLTLALLGIARLITGSDWKRALRLAAAASALRDRSGGPFPRWIAASVGDLRARAEVALGRTAADHEWAVGSRLSNEEAVRLALGGASPRARTRGPLSERELEVARLVAEGMTNSEIARRLHLSQRTAENHVSHILTRLGLANRTQVATWVHCGD